MLNDWKPFTVIPFVTNEKYGEEFYYVVLQVPGFQTMEQFEGNLEECEKECDYLNRMISASLSNHILFNSGSSQ